MRILDAALRWAATRDRAECVRYLLRFGANPYSEDRQGRTAFNCAASNGLRALEMMTRMAFEDTQKPESQRQWKEYNLNTPSGAYGSTLMTYAAKVCDADTVRAMMAAGADIRIVNGSGWNLLHCAAVMPGRYAVLELLLEAFAGLGNHELAWALTTHVYETYYDGRKVVYAAGLSAADLCRTRQEQDPLCPLEFLAYRELLDNSEGLAHAEV